MDSIERIVLVAGPGLEILAAILLLVVGVAGLAVSVVLVRRGRAEAWPVAVLFMLLALFALVVLWHLPTRLAVGRDGIDVGLWFCRGHRDWKEVEAFGVTKNRLGLWVAVAQRGKAGAVPLSVWAPRLGFFIADAPVSAERLTAQVAAWRASAER
ncbi:MAG: hypothetical protein AB7O60_13690 [Variibacter sp.]